MRNYSIIHGLAKDCGNNGNCEPIINQEPTMNNRGGLHILISTLYKQHTQVQNSTVQVQVLYKYKYCIGTACFDYSRYSIKKSIEQQNKNYRSVS